MVRVVGMSLCGCWRALIVLVGVFRVREDGESTSFVGRGKRLRLRITTSVVRACGSIPCINSLLGFKGIFVGIGS